MNRMDEPTRRFIFVAVLVFGLLSGTVQAQPNALIRLWQIALKSNLQLQAQQKTVEQTAARLAIQRSTMLPTLRLIGNYAHISEVARLDLPFFIPGKGPLSIQAGVFDQYSLGVQISQPLFTGWRLHNQYRARQAQLQAATFQQRQAQEQLLLQIGLLFYQWQGLHYQLQILQDGIARAQLHLQRVRQFFLAQQSTAFDTLEVANRVLDLQRQLREVQHHQQVVALRLASLLNQPGPLKLEPIEVQDLNLTLKPLSFYINQAASNRADLFAMERQIQAQQFQVGALKGAYWPTIAAVATYYYARPGVNFFENKWMPYYTIGLQFQWDLWNWNRTGQKVTQAQLKQEQLMLQKQNLWNTIRLQVSEAYHQLLTIRDNIEFQQKIVAQEEQRYQLTRQQFEQGMTTSLQLSEAEKALSAAERQLKRYYIDWLQWKLQLDYVSGRLRKFVEK